MTKEKLAAIRARLAAAANENGLYLPSPNAGFAVFLANAPLDIMALIAEVDRLTSKLDDIEDERDDYRYRLNKADLLT